MHTVILKLVALVGRLLLSVGIHFKLVTDPVRLHFFFTGTESNPGLEGEVRKSYFFSSTDTAHLQNVSQSEVEPGHCG